MESLSRPPHRRKHSTSATIFSSSFSFKNPYDDVLLSNGGEGKSLEAHEYSEIFSGSSSIPVLDLPGLDQRVGSDDFPKSKHDYSNIFGGFSNEDVFVPYEKLLNGSAKKTKPPIPAETRPCLQQSGSLHSSRKTKRSSVEASDQSVEEVKQHFSMSFNKTNQKNSDALDGKTHIAELQAVPGFTHLVDGNPRLHKTKDNKLPSLKREVSRTWSFSTEVEPVKNKGGSSCVTSQIHDMSHCVNEVNLSSQFFKAPPPSSCSSNLNGNNNPRQPKASYFSSKDASQKITGECSPPFFGEEFDENSADAVSAAALKKAIEQAQESIRIAKMIMERRKEVFQDGSMPRPIGGQKFFDKEAKIDREAFVSKDNNVKGKHEELDHIFTLLNEIDGKFTPSLSQNDTFINAANSDVEKVCENVDADEEHAEAFAGKSKLFASNCSQSEILHVDENVTLGKLEKNVEAVETQREGNGFPGLVANTKGSEVVPELVERALDTSQRMQGMVKSVEEDELCQNTSDHAKGHESTLKRALSSSEMMDDELSRATFVHEKGPENMVEGVLHTSQRTSGHYKVVNEAGEDLSICQEVGVNKQRENDANDKEKCGKKLEEHEERLNVENLVLRSEFDNVLNESSEQVSNESLEQEAIEKRSEKDSEWKGNGQHGKISDEEISGTLQKESHDPEFDDKKQVRVDDGNEPKLAEEIMQNKVEEENVNTCESGAAGTIMLEANHYAKVQKRGSFWDVEETDNALGGAGESEGDHRKCEFQEAAVYAEDIDEAVELSNSDASTIFDEAHSNDASSIIGETQEACNVDLNNQVEEHWKTVKNYKENDTVFEVIGTVSAIDKIKKAEPFFHLQDDEILGINSLRRCASEEIFDENKLSNAFEGLSFDGKVETVGVMNADPGANVPEDEDVSNSNSDIHDAAMEYASKISMQNLPEDLASDIRTAEFDFTGAREVLEQASQSDEGSVSASSSEKIDGLSANESEECAANEKDMTSDKELEDELEMISNERKCAEEPSEGLYSQLQSEPKEMDKPQVTIQVVEESLAMETSKENFVGTSSVEERDAKDSVQHSESNDQQQRIEAIKKGREREKNRLAVERAIREARERAFAEARERAERAAVERAAAEARQRVMAEAKEKVEKPYVVKQPVDKASTEAKLRAERAAVERATAEARERALEKAMSQKISTESRTPADRHPTERGSSSSGNNGLKHSFSSSDLETGTNTESAQRRKARLERHQRIMERAAKALAEKNMRDLLAQKEQAERNRLAESLDADIRRWAAGKEGNLRALLSTLQYILGTDSGWQPISLTEIITTAAVKKAYRKATLYVHPDKLQQRGASVQQKYICEKVFDLLKAAWNRFNSDER